MLLTAFMTAGLGFVCLGVLLLLAAATVDAPAPQGSPVKPWELAMLPGLFLALVALGIFGGLAAIGPDENYRRRGAAVLDVLLTMVGVLEPVRAAWLIPTWIAFIVFVVLLLQIRRLVKRIPDL